MAAQLASAQGKTKYLALKTEFVTKICCQSAFGRELVYHETYLLLRKRSKEEK